MTPLPNSPAAHWQPVFAVWQDFVAQNPQLGLSSSLSAQRRFITMHAAALVKAGALAKANGRHWLADTQKFSDSAFLACLGKLEKAA